jgi:hypothetical protein
MGSELLLLGYVLPASLGIGPRWLLVWLFSIMLPRYAAASAHRLQDLVRFHCGCDRSSLWQDTADPRAAGELMARATPRRSEWCREPCQPSFNMHLLMLRSYPSFLAMFGIIMVSSHE